MQVVSIDLGKWEPHQKLIDLKYHFLIKRLKKFAEEAGKDPYGRHFAAEPFIDFVLAKGLTDKSMDYMYRHYVYYKLAQVYKVDIDRLELEDLYMDFILFPENIKLKLKML